MHGFWQSRRQAQFLKAVAVAGEEFVSTVRHLGLAWLPARDIVAQALQTRHDVDMSGRIIRLAQRCPWKVCAAAPL